MTLDDLIAELCTTRDIRGGESTVPEWAESSFRTAGFVGAGSAAPFPPPPDPPGARLPTSREFAVKLTPAVRQAIRETRPGGLWGFLVRALPILLQVVGIILMLLPLFAAAQAKSGAMQAPAGGWRWPWHDEEGDIPEDIQRAARMEG